MGFLDKLKSTAGNAMAAASDAARNVQDKGKEMTEKARLNKAIKLSLIHISEPTRRS